MTRNVTAALGAALLLPLLAACGSTPVEPPAGKTAAISPALDRAATMSLACTGCHNATRGAIPRIEGRPAASIRQSLLEYRSETDGTTVMHRMMRGYSVEDVDAISEYLAGSTPP